MARVISPSPDSPWWIYPKVDDLIIEFAREGYHAERIAVLMGHADVGAIRSYLEQAVDHGHLTDAEAKACGVVSEAAPT